MSLRHYVRVHQASPVIFVPARARAHHAVALPSEAEIKRRLDRFEPILNDGPVPVRGKRIGWKTTNVGSVGAVFVNEVTGRRTLWGLDFQTRRPRQLCVLSN